MKKSLSLINTIYQEVATQEKGENPIYCPEVAMQSSKIFKKYATKENRSEFDSDLGELHVLIEHSAFVAGFKTAIKFMQEITV